MPDVELNWTDNASTEDGFSIERSEDGSAFSEIATVKPDVTTYTDSGAPSGTLAYRVNAFSPDSDYSNEASVTNPYAIPTNATATPVVGTPQTETSSVGSITLNASATSTGITGTVQAETSSVGSITLNASVTITDEQATAVTETSTTVADLTNSTGIPAEATATNSVTSSVQETQATVTSKQATAQTETLSAGGTRTNVTTTPTTGIGEIGFFPAATASATVTERQADGLPQTSSDGLPLTTVTTTQETVKGETWIDYTDPFFETGRVYLSGNDANISNASDSASVSFNRIYDNPVVVAYIASNNGGQDVDARVTNLTGAGCDVFQHEPDYSGHADNYVTYFVAEEGVHETPEGHIIEAGAHTTDETNIDGEDFTGTPVSFTYDWDTTPVVLSTPTTYNNGEWATIGMENTSTNGFEVAQQQGGTTTTDNATAIEDLSWIAVSPFGSGTINGYHAEAGLTTNNNVTYGSAFTSKPEAIAEWQERPGSECGWVRGSTWSTTDLSWYVESTTTSGTYGYFAIEPGEIIEGYPAADNSDGSFTYNGSGSDSHTPSMGYDGTTQDGGNGTYSGTLSSLSSVHETPAATTTTASIKTPDSALLDVTASASAAVASGSDISGTVATMQNATVVTQPAGLTATTGAGGTTATGDVLLDGALTFTETATAMNSVTGSGLVTQQTTGQLTTAPSTGTTSGGTPETAIVEPFGGATTTVTSPGLVEQTSAPTVLAGGSGTTTGSGLIEGSTGTPVTAGASLTVTSSVTTTTSTQSTASVTTTNTSASAVTQTATTTRTLVGFNQQLINGGFEQDPVDTDQPTGWTSVPDGWADVNTKYAESGEKSFGNHYHGEEVGSESVDADVWPNNYHYQDISVSGGEQLKANSVCKNRSWTDSNWTGPKPDQQYIYEDDHRLHLYAYDSNDNIVAEVKSRWSGDAINRGLATRTGGWVYNSIEIDVPDNAVRVRYQIDGGDNNDGYGDPETSHGGNAGIYMDSAVLADAGYARTGQKAGGLPEASTTEDVTANGNNIVAGAGVITRTSTTDITSRSAITVVSSIERGSGTPVGSIGTTDVTGGYNVQPTFTTTVGGNSTTATTAGSLVEQTAAVSLLDGVNTTVGGVGGIAAAIITEQLAGVDTAVSSAASKRQAEFTTYGDAVTTATGGQRTTSVTQSNTGSTFTSVTGATVLDTITTTDVPGIGVNSVTSPAVVDSMQTLTINGGGVTSQTAGSTTPLSVGTILTSIGETSVTGGTALPTATITGFGTGITATNGQSLTTTSSINSDLADSTADATAAANVTSRNTTTTIGVGDTGTVSSSGVTTSITMPVTASSTTATIDPTTTTISETNPQVGIGTITTTVAAKTIHGSVDVFESSSEIQVDAGTTTAVLNTDTSIGTTTTTSGSIVETAYATSLGITPEAAAGAVVVGDGMLALPITSTGVNTVTANGLVTPTTGNGLPSGTSSTTSKSTTTAAISDATLGIAYRTSTGGETTLVSALTVTADSITGTIADSLTATGETLTATATGVTDATDTPTPTQATTETIVAPLLSTVLAYGQVTATGTTQYGHAITGQYDGGITDSSLTGSVAGGDTTTTSQRKRVESSATPTVATALTDTSGTGTGSMQGDGVVSDPVTTTGGVGSVITTLATEQPSVGDTAVLDSTRLVSSVTMPTMSIGDTKTTANSIPTVATGTVTAIRTLLNAVSSPTSTVIHPRDGAGETGATGGATKRVNTTPVIEKGTATVSTDLTPTDAVTGTTFYANAGIATTTDTPIPTTSSGIPLDGEPMTNTTALSGIVSVQTTEVAVTTRLVVQCAAAQIEPETLQATGVASGIGGEVNTGSVDTAGDASTFSDSESPPTAVLATPGAGGGQTVATDGGQVLAAADPSASSGTTAANGGTVTPGVGTMSPSDPVTTATSMNTETAATTAGFGADATTATVSLIANDSMLGWPVTSDDNYTTVTADAEPESLVSLGKYIEPHTATNADSTPPLASTIIVPASVFSTVKGGGQPPRPRITPVESPAFTTALGTGFSTAITWTLKSPATSASVGGGTSLTITSSVYEADATTSATGGSPVVLLSGILEAEGPLIQTPGLLPDVETGIEGLHLTTGFQRDRQITSVGVDTRFSVVVDDVTTDFDIND